MKSHRELKRQLREINQYVIENHDIPASLCNLAGAVNAINWMLGREMLSPVQKMIVADRAFKEENGCTTKV